MTAREELLARARRALGPSAPVPEVPRNYDTAGSRDLDPVELVKLFSDRAGDYGATMHVASAGALEGPLSAIAKGAGARRLVAPPALFLALEDVDVVLDEPSLSADALEQVDGALTGSALAIADTGTIVLDGGHNSGRRIISLIPDVHICLVQAASIVATIPDAIARLAREARNTAPLTFISGPSATVDIGFERVEGVHGPRRLCVVIVQ